nr:SpoIIE family protein phosphatase [Lachnospiraceae bacterium]
YLHISTSIDNAIRLNLYSGRMIAEHLDPVLVTKLFEQGIEIYDGLPEEIRKNRQSKEYLDYFDALKGEGYNKLKADLEEAERYEDIRWIDLRIADPENERWIYLISTYEDEDERFAPGYWETADETINTYRDSTDDELIDEESVWYPITFLKSFFYLDFKNIDRFSTTTDYYHPETGELIGFVGTTEFYDDYREDISDFRIMNLVLLIFALLGVFVIFGLISRWLTRPLTDLTAAAQNYVTDTAGSGNSGYFERVKIKSHDEVSLLRDSMVDMEAALSQYIQDITRMTAEKERSAVEMELCARIQAGLFTDTLGSHITKLYCNVNALIEPAREVGGDFYDYYAIDDDHIAITIADVSGKGMPAALFMVLAKTFLSMEGMKSKSPSAIIKEVNRKLCGQNPETMFVTIFFGIYTLSEKKLAYVNAGHEDAILYKSKEGGFSLRQEEHDLIAGIFPDAEFTERILFFETGDKLFLYTDGVPEAQNYQEEMFGKERMLTGLNELKEFSGEEFLRKMKEYVACFTKDAAQYDDITMMLFEVL